jgi:hypothetical protein
MNRETFIEKLTQVQQNVEQLLTQLQASEHDKFAAHLYRSRREYRLVCQHAGKSGKQIERSAYRASRSPKVWAVRANFANGSTFCESEIDHAWLSRSNFGCPGGSRS